MSDTNVMDQIEQMYAPTP
ncbi:hypothetical protein SEA_GILBERTA_84 [Mycobacterium phage Gilberta]|nr:hypothetical protein SEA_GILBERTA_84 [Mycobacterium phage Gilberta]